jgi:hypothetical protein
VRYEELVFNTKATLTHVCAHIDLTFQETMLNYHERVPQRLREHKGRLLPDGTRLVTQEQRLDQQKLTTEPPKPERVFVWKQVMNSNEIERFETVAGDLLGIWDTKCQCHNAVLSTLMLLAGHFGILEQHTNRLQKGEPKDQQCWY